MKRIIGTAMTVAMLGWMGCAEKTAPTAPAAETEESPEAVEAAVAAPTDLQVAEVACGSCIYKMDGVSGCKTAIKIGEEKYMLAGETIDAHSTGLCKAAKAVKVAGAVADGAYVATKIELTPAL